VSVALDALLDSGATGLFLDSKYVRAHSMNTRKLPRAVPVYNVDSTLNQGGSIQEEVDVIMTYNNHTEKATFAVCDLGDKAGIIGHTWLHSHNPEINWKTGEVNFTRCPSKCKVQVRKAKSGRKRVKKALGKLPLLHSEEAEPEDTEPEDIEMQSEWEDTDRVWVSFLHPQHNVNATNTVSQKLAQQNKPDWEKKTFEEIVPVQYHEHKAVFSKDSFDELPTKKPWDHAIELKPDFEPTRSKLYPLSPNEQDELDQFLDENLKSGRIRPSKSPQAVPVFFVKKKDGSLRLVQDYRKLNDMTIKNSYPLPLISDMINKLSKAKWFSKLDVRWGYNNIRMKEGNEWKATFRTNRGMFY
jgi:hypothetical protein